MHNMKDPWTQDCQTYGFQTYFLHMIISNTQTVEAGVQANLPMEITALSLGTLDIYSYIGFFHMSEHPQPCETWTFIWHT